MCACISAYLYVERLLVITDTIGSLSLAVAVQRKGKLKPSGCPSWNLQKLLSLWKAPEWRKLLVTTVVSYDASRYSQYMIKNCVQIMVQLRIPVKMKGEEKRGIILRLLICLVLKKILKISKLMRHKIISLLCSWFSSASYKRAIIREESMPLAVSSEWLCKTLLKGPLTSFCQSLKGLWSAACCSVSDSHCTWGCVGWQRCPRSAVCFKAAVCEVCDWGRYPSRGVIWVPCPPMQQWGW